MSDRDVLYPYKILGTELSMNIGTPVLDGRAQSGSLSQTEGRMVNLFQIKHEWTLAGLPILVEADQDLLERFESEHGPVTLIVVANCRPTNTRQSLRLASTQRGRWEGTLELERQNFRERAELRPVMTAVGAGGQRPVGFAVPWNVYFDDPPSFRFRGTLAVRWINFKTPPADAPPIVKQFPDSTHVVSFAGGIPEVLLNSAFDGLEPLLRDRRDRRGADRGLHDMQRISIARAVWMALVGDALAAVKPGDEDEAPDWPDEDWQKEVLKRIVMTIDPNKSPAELLSMAATEWRSHPGAAEFYAHAEAIIGDVVEANASLRRFALTYGQEEQS